MFIHQVLCALEKVTRDVGVASMWHMYLYVKDGYTCGKTKKKWLQIKLHLLKCFDIFREFPKLIQSIFTQNLHYTLKSFGRMMRKWDSNGIIALQCDFKFA